MLYCLCIKCYYNDGNCALTTIQPSFVLGHIRNCLGKLRVTQILSQSLLHWTETMSLKVEMKNTSIGLCTTAI